MACRGYFLALDGPCTARLLAAHGDDQRVIEVIQELDMTGAPDGCGADKAWDGIHRCLTEGKLGSDDGTYPLNAVILGGLPLHQGDDYVVSYNPPRSGPRGRRGTLRLRPFAVPRQVPGTRPGRLRRRNRRTDRPILGAFITGNGSTMLGRGRIVL
jgi:hypothetical protein